MRRVRPHCRAAWAFAAAALTLGGGAVLASAQPVTINGGATVTNNPQLLLTLEPPPAAVFVQVGEDPSFVSSETSPVAASVTFRLAAGAPEERPRTVWVRYLDAAQAPLPLAAAAAGITLDTLPPRFERLSLRQREPIFACTEHGPGVGGTSRSQLVMELRVRLGEAGAGGPQFELDGVPGAAGALQDPRRPLQVQAPPARQIAIRSRDAIGNVSAWMPLTTPRAEVTALSAARLPFAYVSDCPQPGRFAWIARVRRAWGPGSHGARHRQILRVPVSRLAWTFYAGQGLGLNWVHAATELKARLKQRRLGDYRAAVAEIVAMSTVGRSPSDRPFRINENLFPIPEGHPAPWRDGMGTALLLASLAPAIQPGAPRAERDLARTVAGQYLETLSVDSRDGGVTWGGGPGQWILEYAFRRDDRVLNGSMQALVSLVRFARQADRLALGDAAWRTLADQARRDVVEGGRALDHWLPAYDLGGGATRYSLYGPAAIQKYRLYHQVLLGQLSQVPYLPLEWRRHYMDYRVRWGGSPLPVR